MPVSYGFRVPQQNSSLINEQNGYKKNINMEHQIRGKGMIMVAHHGRGEGNEAHNEKTKEITPDVGNAAGFDVLEYLQLNNPETSKEHETEGIAYEKIRMFPHMGKNVVVHRSAGHLGQRQTEDQKGHCNGVDAVSKIFKPVKGEVRRILLSHYSASWVCEHVK